MLHSHAIRHLTLLFYRVFFFHILEWIKIFRVSKIFLRAFEILAGLKSGCQGPGEGVESGTEPHTFLRAALGTQSWLLRGSPPRSGGSLHPLPAHISRGQWGDPRPAQQKVLRGHWNANSSS